METSVSKQRLSIFSYMSGKGAALESFRSFYLVNAQPCHDSSSSIVENFK